MQCQRIYTKNIAISGMIISMLELIRDKRMNVAKVPAAKKKHENKPFIEYCRDRRNAFNITQHYMAGVPTLMYFSVQQLHEKKKYTEAVGTIAMT